MAFLVLFRIPEELQQAFGALLEPPTEKTKEEKENPPGVLRNSLNRGGKTAQNSAGALKLKAAGVSVI